MQKKDVSVNKVKRRDYMLCNNNKITRYLNFMWKQNERSSF